MDKKYMHSSFKLAEEFFKRSFSFEGSTIHSSYAFNYDIPYIGKRAVANDEYVYDYSKLIGCENLDILETPDLVGIHKLSALNVAQFDEIVRNNIAVAGHMHQLKKNLEILAELEAL